MQNRFGWFGLRLFWLGWRWQETVRVNNWCWRCWSLSIWKRIKFLSERSFSNPLVKRDSLSPPSTYRNFWRARILLKPSIPTSDICVFNHHKLKSFRVDLSTNLLCTIPRTFVDIQFHVYHGSLHRSTAASSLTSIVELGWSDKKKLIWLRFSPLEHTWNFHYHRLGGVWENLRRASIGDNFSSCGNRLSPILCSSDENRCFQFNYTTLIACFHAATCCIDV